MALSDLRQGFQATLCDYFSRRFNCNDQDAEELAADVLVRVHGAVANFNPDGGAKLSTWIVEIAHNLGIDWVRKQERLAIKGVAPIPLDADTEKAYVRQRVNDWFREGEASQSTAPEFCRESSDLPQNVQCMGRARSALSADDRSLLEMRLTMSNREIADAEGVAEGTIRTRYSRAVTRLRAAYEKEMNL